MFKKRLVSAVLAGVVVFAVALVVKVSAEEIHLPTITKYFAGNTYAVYDVSMTWVEAKAYCEQLGGYLVTITSNEEQEIITSLLRVC